MQDIPNWPPVAHRTRGPRVETIHTGGAVALDNAGKLLWSIGDPDAKTFFRSSVKCWQALPLVKTGAADRFGFTPQELALAVASHEGEEYHAATAAGMLKKLGLGPEHLRCGAHPPYSRSAAYGLARRGERPSTLHNNCSGKHSGMLASCLHNGWSIEDYLRPDHPLQAMIRAEISAASGLPESDLPYGTDGCGVPTYYLPLRNMAKMFSALGAAPSSEPLGRLGDAMRAHPEMVAGPEEFDTQLPIATQGRLITKRGGAALGCLATRDGIGIVVKCGDGNHDVVPPLLMRGLEVLGLLQPAEREALHAFIAPVQKNVAGAEIGELRVIV